MGCDEKIHQYTKYTRHTFIVCCCSTDESISGSLCTAAVGSSVDPSVSIETVVSSDGGMVDASGITCDDSLGVVRSNCWGSVIADVSAALTCWSDSAVVVSVSLSEST